MRACRLLVVVAAGVTASSARADTTHGVGAPRSVEYRVGPGDVLDVRVYGEDDLSGLVVVSEDCTIPLAYIGRVAACGQSASVLGEAIRDAYAVDYLVNPAVAVRVEEYRSQKVDVLGAVAKSGPVYLRGPTSLVEVISEAGGPMGDNVVRVDVFSENGGVLHHKLPEVMLDPDGIVVSNGDTIILKPGEVVFLEGEVARPGSIIYTDDLTVTQALALAGGPREFAALRRVLVRRADGSKQRVNVVRIHRGLSDDVALAADDHVLVPTGAF